MERTYLTTVEAADELRISARTLERMRLEGTGPTFTKAGRRVLYRPSDIESWLEQHRFASTAAAKVQAA